MTFDKVFFGSKNQRTHVKEKIQYRDGGHPVARRDIKPCSI